MRNLPLRRVSSDDLKTDSMDYFLRFAEKPSNPNPTNSIA